MCLKICIIPSCMSGRRHRLSAPKRGTVLPAKLPVASMETERTGCFRLFLGHQCAAPGFSEADMAQSLHELVTVNPGAVQSFEPKMTGGLCRKWPSGTEPDVLVIRSTLRPTISNWQPLVMIEGQSVEEVNSSSLDEFIVAEVWAGTLQCIVSAGSVSAPP